MKSRPMPAGLIIQEKNGKLLSYNPQEIDQEAKRLSGKRSNKDKNSSRDNPLLSVSEVLGALELGLNYDFRVDLTDTLFFQSYGSISIEIPYGVNSDIYESDMLDAYDEAFNQLKNFVDYDNDIVLLGVMVEIINVANPDLELAIVPVVCSADPNVTRMDAIGPNEQYNAGGNSYGCNGYTGIHPNAGVRLRHYINPNWNYYAPAAPYGYYHYAHTPMQVRQQHQSIKKCADGKYYLGPASTCLDNPTLTGWANNFDKMVGCILQDLRLQHNYNYLGSLNYNWFQTTGSFTRGHAGDLRYAVVGTSSGRGSGYN